MHCLSLSQNYLRIYTNDEPNGECITIDRRNLQRVTEAVSEESIENVKFHFLLGAYEVNGIMFLAAATKVESVTDFWNIQKATGFKVLQLNEPEQRNEEIANLVFNGLSLTPLFYSNTNDLTLTLQLQTKEENCPRRSFLWNYKPLIALERILQTKEFSMQVITGFVNSFETNDLKFILISRRSRIRAGSRFWMRGADENGFTANYVETEQIISIGNKAYGFVQIRGSIPVVWSQCPDLTRTPKIHLGPENESRVAFENHFRRLSEEYGSIIAVSLTNSSGIEKPLTDIYGRLGDQNRDISYYYFDFHKECSKMRFNNINTLIEKIQDKLDSIGYCYVENGRLIQEQSGVLRSNCIDCLDRTGVLQSSVAQLILQKQLNENGIGYNFDDKFRNIWTDNADETSIQYSGTPALKTDYTRTGKRTMFGALNDGKNSITRYYINTCLDGTRQDEYDIITQEVKCGTYNKGINPFMVLLLFIRTILIFLFTFITKGKKAAFQVKKQCGVQSVNRPSFRSIRDFSIEQEQSKE